MEGDTPRRWIWLVLAAPIVAVAGVLFLDDAFVAVSLTFVSIAMLIGALLIVLPGGYQVLRDRRLPGWLGRPVYFTQAQRLYAANGIPSGVLRRQGVGHLLLGSAIAFFDIAWLLHYHRVLGITAALALMACGFLLLVIGGWYTLRHVARERRRAWG